MSDVDSHLSVSDAFVGRRSAPGNARGSAPAWVWAVAIAVLTFAVYAPAMRGGFLWDDDQYVARNPHVVSPDRLDGLSRIWTTAESPQYYPLVFTTFWVEHQLWGLHTFGYHAVNVGLHVVNALLFGLVLRRLGLPGAWAAAAVFALHPVHVESVAWITQRKNVLSGMFYLCSVLAFLRFDRKRGSGWYVLSLALFAMALLSKTATLMLPVVLVLLRWWMGGSWRPRDVAALVPFFLCSLAMAAVTIGYERHFVGARGPDWSASIAQRVALAGCIPWFYLSKLVLPVHLSFVYHRWVVDASSPLTYLPAVCAVAVAGVLWTRRRTWAAPFCVGLGCLLAPLFPVLGFFNVYYMRYSYVADHFAYLASMGLIALLVSGIASIFALDRVRSWRRHAARMIAASSVFAALGVSTWRQAAAYTDAETLWRDTLAKVPTAWLAHYNLGGLVLARGEYEPATRHFLAVLAIKPDFSDAHNSLGYIFSALGLYDEAREQYNKALESWPENPGALYNLGREMARRKRIDDAIDYYRRALTADPMLSEAHNNLGRILLERGDLPRAAHHFEQAIHFRPDNAEAHLNLGNVFELRADASRAASLYERALVLKPDFARALYRLAICQVDLGRRDQAVDQLTRTLQLDPRLVDAEIDLAGLLRSMEMTGPAMEHYRAAIRLVPADGRVRHDAVTLLKMRGEYAEAERILREGLRGNSGDLGLIHDLAILLASCPDETIRRGDEAMELAKRLVDSLGSDNSLALGALAIAYAETGDLDSAAAHIGRALQLARTAGDLEAVSRLERYQTSIQARQPYREP